MLHSLAIAVTEPSQVGQARRAATTVAESVGFDRDRAGRVALAATEAANNLHLHGKGGELLIRALDDHGVGGVELLALDKGPGIPDVDRAMEDGFSTLGTAGQGLGAMSRAADEFEIYTQPGAGTALLLRFWAGPRPKDPSGLISSGINVPLAGEDVSGDAFASDPGASWSRFLLADGLGHGTGAATAAVEAVKTFHEERAPDPAILVKSIHERIRHTRGAALAVAVVNPAEQQVRYCGVGNVVSLVVGTDGRRQNMVSMNGTVGHAVRAVQEFGYAFPPGSLLVMHSDGVGTGWSLDRYPGLITRHPSLVAGVLYRDFRRVRDDSSILIMREKGRHE